jgi:hypothetical protein
VRTAYQPGGVPRRKEIDLHAKTHTSPGRRRRPRRAGRDGGGGRTGTRRARVPAPLPLRAGLDRKQQREQRTRLLGDRLQPRVQRQRRPRRHRCRRGGRYDRGGYYTYYAHLNRRAVVAGQSVLRGQAIGSVGNTSRSGNNITPHLHYEVRYPDRSQSHIIKAVFNGSTFGYSSATVTSRNCATSYDPAQECGSGFEVVDSVRLGSAGTANLLWKASTSQNCVITLKMASVGTPTTTSAFLEPQGSTRTTDSGGYSYYAGPVIRTAPTCVKWGGSAGGTTYTSPFEHC